MWPGPCWWSWSGASFTAVFSQFHRVVPIQHGTGLACHNSCLLLGMFRALLVMRFREAEMTSWQLAFGFFNGDLMNEMRWEHWCTGCCSDEASSLAKAGHPMGQQSTLPNKTSFIFIPCFCKGGQPKIGVTACPSLLCPCRPRSCFPMPSSAAWSFTILNVGICAHLL